MIDQKLKEQLRYLYDMRLVVLPEDKKRLTVILDKVLTSTLERTLHDLKLGLITPEEFFKKYDNKYVKESLALNDTRKNSTK